VLKQQAYQLLFGLPVLLRKSIKGASQLALSLNALYISMMQRGADQRPLLSVCTVLNRLDMERLFQVQVLDRRWR
tara:strand:+ start:4041 stop:4265 length:225 start_codon:yes stop_codon:yes gene_type:complete